VGRVCIAVSRRGFATQDAELNYGDIGRDAIRECAARDALKAALEVFVASPL
jgi:nicotinamide mononucleotide (NMN) deamidase PncC